MLYIENGGTRLGILPDVGGRVVMLSRNGAPNIFKSDYRLWEEGERLQPAADQLEFRAYNGQEVWVGPQCEWWKHQDLNEEQKHSTLFWPPDPYISYGSFTVVRHISCEVTMVGPESPISGVRLKKHIMITADGVVHYDVEATNIRKEPVSWDLWLIARTNGNNPTFVPVSSPFDVRVTGATHPDFSHLRQNAGVSVTMRVRERRLYVRHVRLSLHSVVAICWLYALSTIIQTSCILHKVRWKSTITRRLMMMS